MAGPRRPREAMDAAYLMAYKLRYEDRLLYPQILAELSKEYPQCGSKTTAIRWVAEGYRLVHLNEDGMTDPMSRRPVRRETAGDTFDSLFVKIEQDMTAGHIPRKVGRALQMRAVENYVHLHGLRRAPALPRVKRSDGSKTAATPGELLDSLFAPEMREELEALIDRTLPDERTDR